MKSSLIALAVTVFANTAFLPVGAAESAASPSSTEPIGTMPDVQKIYDSGVEEARANLVSKLRTVSEKDPARKELLFKLAALEYADDNYDLAIEKLNAIKPLGATGDESLALNRFLGLSHLSAGRAVQAATFLRQALSESKPNSVTRLKILRSLDDALELTEAPVEEQVSTGEQTAQLADELGLKVEAGWAYLHISDVQKKADMSADAQRSFDRAVVMFTRYFNEQQNNPKPPVVAIDLWEALDALPERPPGAFWKAQASPPKAVVLCIHGLGLHSGFYEAFGKALAERGISVAAMDVRGFGEWTATAAGTDIDIKEAVNDTTRLVRALHKLNPGVPIFLLGESMGGAVALRAAKDADVAGVISSVPAADRYNALATKMRIAWHVIRQGNSEYDVRKDVVDKVSHNEKLREKWEQDRLAKLQYSPTQLINFQKFMKQNLKEAESVTLPVLITQGDSDELVKSDSTIKLFRALGSKNKDLILIGAGEHLIFEAGQFSPVLIDGLVAWISAVAKQQSARAAVATPTTP